MNKLDLSRPADRVFSSILKCQAEQTGSTPFLVNDDASITFAAAEDITNRLATGLEKLGIGRGDCVAMYMGNRPEMVLMALAVNKLGRSGPRSALTTRAPGSLTPCNAATANCW